MAKRAADQQLTKDGAMSDEDVFSVGSQIAGPQRATAAQMAQRRLAKPRGGRRPGALRPPASPSHSLSQQHQQIFENDRSNVNGTQQQQGGFAFGQQANGNQPNLNSSSFPPFPSSSFNTPFSAPTSGFSFNVGNSQAVNNPFTAINTHHSPPPEPAGFQGSIFNLPPQELSPFQKFLEGEQKPLFAPGAPDLSAPAQSQPSTNLFDQSINQHGSTQAGPGTFLQSNAPQQPSNNTFSQGTEQKAPQSSPEMFAHPKTPQSQSSSNPFAQSISQFQQSQSAQPAANLFAHLGQPQPSSGFLTQSSTSPTQGGASMMQISPDPSPQSRPFGFLNQPSVQTQSSPTKESAVQGGGGSLFDRISQHPAETESQPQSSQTKEATAPAFGGSLFDRISKPPAETESRPESSQTQDATAPAFGGSLFDRISKPPTEPSAQTLFSPPHTNADTHGGSLFKMPQPQDTSKASNEEGSTSPTKVSERKIAKPTLFKASSEDEHPPYKAIFGSLKMPPSPQSSPPPTRSGIAAAPQSSPLQSKGDTASLARGGTNTQSLSSFSPQSSERPMSMADTCRKFGPPPPPEGYSEEEKQKWSQNWWISFYVRHKEKRVRYEENQCDARIKAVLDGFEPLEQIAGSKRKPLTEDHRSNENEILGKRARIETSSIFTQDARGASSDGTSKSQPSSKRDTPSQQVVNKNNKRSADEEPQRENTQRIGDKSKKARGHDPVSLSPSLAASPGSQTSNIFKNILDKKEEAKVNGTLINRAPPTFQLQAPSASPSTQSPSTSKSSSTTSVLPSSKPDIESPFKSSSASFNPASSISSSRPFGDQNSISNGAQLTTFTPSLKPSSFADDPPTAPDSNPFSFKPIISSEAPSDATKALAVKFSSGATTSTASSSSPFAAKPTVSDQTSSESAKAPAFKVPSFGAATPSTASDSSPFSIKPPTSGQTSSEALKAPAFKVPNFGAGISGTTSTNFMSQFGKAAEKTEAEAKKKRKADDFDSDEEDLASWEARDAEEQRLKKQKIEDEIKGKTAKVIDGKWVIAADSEKPSASIKPTNSTGPNLSVLSQPTTQLTNGHNIFGHLSGEDSGAESGKTGDADDEDDEDENDHDTNGQDDEAETESDNDEEAQPEMPKALNSPFGASLNGPFDASPYYNDDSAQNGNGEDTGRSIFDRISKDNDGKPIREIPNKDGQAASQTSNVFSQSSKSGSSNNLFSQPSDTASSLTSTNSNVGKSPKGDHTWKVDSAIKFGDSSNAPAVSITSPSPSKPTFGGLFGAAKSTVTNEMPSKSTSSIFSTPLAKTPSVGFGFGFKPTTASLAPPANNDSNATSRATSPGATTGESANESNADGEDDKAERQEQIDLTSSGPGEEDEDVIMQVKAKALQWDKDLSSWTSKGLGPLRVLRNRESQHTRVLLRQDPSGKIVLNFALSKSFTYESSQSKTVRVPIVNESGKIESWMIKVGNDEDAKKLASTMEDNRI